MFEKQPWMQRAGEYPQTDPEYFALLARAVFSAGLGPKVVESRWADMGEAFHGFDPAQVTQMDEEDVARLLSDPAVIRNRRKIEAVIKNAGTFLEQVEERKAAAGEAAWRGPRRRLPTVTPRSTTISWTWAPAPTWISRPTAWRRCSPIWGARRPCSSSSAPVGGPGRAGALEGLAPRANG